MPDTAFSYLSHSSVNTQLTTSTHAVSAEYKSRVEAHSMNKNQWQVCATVTLFDWAVVRATAAALREARLKRGLQMRG